jgi:ABC-type transport system substrate-binding protein
MKTGKLLLIVACVGLIAAATSSPVSAQRSDKHGGALIYSNANNYQLTDPHRYRGSAGREFIAPMFSTLFMYNVNAEVVPDAATSMEVVSAKEFRVNLRDDVKFHNGTPLRANDVVYSIKRILDPKTGAQLRGQLTEIQDIKAVKNHAVLFTFKHTVSPEWFREMMAQTESSILSEAWMAGRTGELTEYMGSGPFMWESFVSGVKITEKRNPNYYRKDADGNRLPYLDRLEFVGYPDSARRVTALKAGDVDLDGFIPWELLEKFTKDPNFDVDIATEAFMDLTFNVKQPPFDNPKVRQAFAYAIDREKIAQLAFYGFATPIYGGILGYQPWNWAYNPQSKGAFEYNPDKAKKLLAEAGYPNGFKASILTSADDQMHIDTSQVIVEEMKKVGVDIDIRLEEWGRRVAAGNKGDYGLAISGTGAKMLDPDWVSAYFHAGEGYYHRPAGWDFPEMDKLLDTARVTQDQNKRKELYQKWDNMFVKESPEVFLVYRATGGVRQKWIHGFKYFPGGLNTASADSLEHTWIDKNSPRKK